VIDGATSTVVGQPITVAEFPYFLTVNPATNRVYVTNFDASSVTVIDGARTPSSGRLSR